MDLGAFFDEEEARLLTAARLQIAAELADPEFQKRQAEKHAAFLAAHPNDVDLDADTSEDDEDTDETEDD